MNLALVRVHVHGQRYVVPFVTLHRIWIADCPTLPIFVGYKRVPVVCRCNGLRGVTIFGC